MQLSSSQPLRALGVGCRIVGFRISRGDEGELSLLSRIGPAAISRRAVFTGNKALEYDGYAERTINSPADTPPGLYDLVYALNDEVNAAYVSGALSRLEMPRRSKPCWIAIAFRS